MWCCSTPAVRQLDHQHNPLDTTLSWGSRHHRRTTKVGLRTSHCKCHYDALAFVATVYLVAVFQWSLVSRPTDSANLIARLLRILLVTSGYPITHTDKIISMSRHNEPSSFVRRTRRTVPHECHNIWPTSPEVLRTDSGCDGRASGCDDSLWMPA